MIPSELWTSAKNALEAYRTGKTSELYVNVLGEVNPKEGLRLLKSLLPTVDYLNGPAFKPLHSAHDLLLAANEAVEDKIEGLFWQMEANKEEVWRKDRFYYAVSWGATQEAIRQTRLYVESEKILESEL